MRSSMTAIALALTIGMGAPAIAAQQAQAQGQAQAQAQVKPSKGAHKAILELHLAVKANDAANIPAKLAAAQAAAKTDEDRYLIAVERYKAAKAANSEPAAMAALADIVSSSLVERDKLVPLTLELAVAQLKAKQTAQAQASLQRALAIEPNNPDALAFLGEAHHAGGRTSEAVEMYRKSLAASSASGQKAKEIRYKRAVELAAKAKMPAALELSRQWAAAYPNARTWSTALGVYASQTQMDEDRSLDLLRLMRATGAMNSSSDFQKYAGLALYRGYPAEAKAVLEEGIAAGKVNANDAAVKPLLAEARTKAKSDAIDVAKTVQAGKAAATAKAALTSAELLYGIGEYASAAEVYRAALGKPGADSAHLNLRLGMALANAGDKAAATSAFNAVTGAHAELAKFWLLYLSAAA